MVAIPSINDPIMTHALSPTRASRLFRFAPLLPLALAAFLTACSDSGDDATVYETKKLEPPAATAPAEAMHDHDHDHGAEAALPEGHPPIDAAPADMGMNMDGATIPEELIGQGDLPEWQLPEGWELTAPKPMRKANIAVGESGLELAVTSFPGAVGGLSANVNRWRGQLGLTPPTAEEMAESVRETEINGKQFFLVDLTGPAAEDGSAQRMLSAVVIHNGNSWFFKMTGPADAVEAASGDYGAFIDSIRFE